MNKEESKKAFKIHTFGCKVNTYDTGLLDSRLVKAGFCREDKSDDQSAGIHIINSCAVTAEATKEAQRRLRQIKAKNPFATVVVTGCAAQVDTDKFSALAGADLIVANSHKGQLEKLIEGYQKGLIKEKVFKSNIFKKLELEEGGGTEARHTRAFLKIQDGCNSFCTYCVIPFARGKSRSISVDSLVARINALLTEGVKEVVLAGVHIGDYQDDKYGSEPGPEGLIEQILLRTSLPRLRLSSLEPVEVTDRLIELCQDSRICSHFHMSIQSACTPTLQRMKRNYGAAEVEFSLKRIAREFPDAFVGMDFIVGFPGESESEFMDSFTRLSYLPWTKIHVFPYSERPGTYANRLDEKNAPKEIGERAKRLQALSLERHAQAGLNQVGKDKEVLVLKQKDGAYQGLSRDYWPVQIESLKPLTSGEEIRVRIQGFDSSSSLKAKNSLFGVPLDLLSGPEMQASTHS